MQKNDFIVDTKQGHDPAYLSNKVGMTPTALLTPEGRARYAAAQFAFDAATSKAAKATAWNEILHVMARRPLYEFTDKEMYQRLRKGVQAHQNGSADGPNSWLLLHQCLRAAAYLAHGLRGRTDEEGSSLMASVEAAVESAYEQAGVACWHLREPELTVEEVTSNED